MDTRQVVLLRLPPGLKVAIQNRAVDSRRSLTREIQIAIERYLAPAQQANADVAANLS